MENNNLMPSGDIIRPSINLNDCKPSITERNRNLEKLLAVSEELNETKSKKIIFQKPLINFRTNGVIFPKSITLIQGQAGSHKSRLAQGICSLILSKTVNDFLGFEFIYDKPVTLCYLDTERNIKDQFPYALQSIQNHAGYKYAEKLKRFKFSSFITIPRTERMDTLESYVQHLRKETDGHLFIVMDVITDFVADFNRVDESLGCIDWMNKMINEYDISFLVIIHENPGAEKARGHIGTELLNKVTTAIQINPERDMEDEGIYKVAFKKNRNTQSLGFIHVTYSQQTKGLVIVPPDEIGEIRSNNVKKANPSEVIDFLLEQLSEKEMLGRELITLMVSRFTASERTIRDRLDEIISSGKQIQRVDGVNFLLVRSKKGREIYYSLPKQ